MQLTVQRGPIMFNQTLSDRTWTVTGAVQDYSANWRMMQLSCAGMSGYIRHCQWNRGSNWSCPRLLPSECQYRCPVLVCLSASGTVWQNEGSNWRCPELMFQWKIQVSCIGVCLATSDTVWQNKDRSWYCPKSLSHQNAKLSSVLQHQTLSGRTWIVTGTVLKISSANRNGPGGEGLFGLIMVRQNCPKPYWLQCLMNRLD